VDFIGEIEISIAEGEMKLRIEVFTGVDAEIPGTTIKWVSFDGALHLLMD